MSISIAAAEPTPPDAGAVHLRGPAWLVAALMLAGGCASSGQTQVEIAPIGDLYPRAIADPQRPQLGATIFEAVDEDIQAVGNSRWMLRAGDRIPIVRVHPPNEPQRGWQVDVEGQFVGMNDIDDSEDVIGWDGLYGVQVAWTSGAATAWRLALLHDSSHFGDEYDPPTPLPDDNATREDLILGVSRELSRSWRAYLEYVHAGHLSNDPLLDEVRFQGGLELVPAPSMLQGRLGWFAAVHASSYEENDWKGNVTLRAGLAWPLLHLGRTWRIGLELHHGRPPQGEFLDARETWVGVGLWM
jgi:hypothetical protein